MRFNGICIVTQNVPRLCAFYREILKLEPEEGDVFKIIPTEGAVLSIFSSNWIGQNGLAYSKDPFDIELGYESIHIF